MRTPIPRFVTHEIDVAASYPIKLATIAGEARCRRSSWAHENEGLDAPAIRHRESAGWLHDDDAQRIGLLTLEEYELEPGVYWEDFWRFADGFAERMD
jgi:hypothetical protein